MSLAAYFHSKTYGIQFLRHKHQGLMLRKVIFNLIKENHGLREDDGIAEHMIPTTFHEETEFLSDSNLNNLKRHYMTFYRKVRKNFLDYIEDSMSHDSLIGFTISTRSKKSVSCASKISSPSVLSHDPKTSQVSEKDNPHDFYPKNFNHAFLPKPDFEGYRNNSKK
jgi:dynactin complex subunit